MPTGSTAEMQEVITRFSPGDKVRISFLRGGKPMEATVTLRNSSGTYAKVSSDDKLSLGAKLSAADQETLGRLELRGGVAVESVESEGRFASAGIREGLVIISVNNMTVTTPEDVEKIVKALKSAPSRDKVLFITGVYPSGKVAHFAVDLSD